MIDDGSRNGRARWRAIVLDLDGTLVADDGRIAPANVRALRALEARGVPVVIATGRSELSTLPVLDELELDGPAFVFNGAALWSRAEGRFLEERTLADPTRDRAIDFGLERGVLTVTMCAGKKYAIEPDRDVGRLALHDLHGLEIVPPEGLRAERALRVTLFSDRFADSAAFAAEIEARLGRPAYIVHFPLNLLPQHRRSPLSIVDVHAPCRGKGEALRWLHEQHGIRPGEVVCVGDATNDVEMLERAGLSVAMENAMPEVRARVDRVIGDNNGNAIADLVDELFVS